MKDDPTIERIRKSRAKISQRFGHDSKKLVEHYMKKQKSKKLRQDHNRKQLAV
jgi:hypothetical protein